MSRSRPKPPVFLDRDGTIIEEMEYLASLDQMRLIAGAAQAMRRANLAGHPLIVITNQSGVARGLFSGAFAHRSAERLRELLDAEGARVDGYYFCPFHPEGLAPYNMDHPDRKPAPGMMRRAARELGLTLQGAFMIGDRDSDVETGAGLGVIPVLVRTGYGRCYEPLLARDFTTRGGRVFDDLAAALAWIVGACH